MQSGKSYARVGKFIQYAIIKTEPWRLRVLLQRENNPHLNTVTAYDTEYVEINREKHHSSICLRPEGPIEPLPITQASDINLELLREITGLDQRQQDPMAFLNDEPAPLPEQAPEVLLIGTGPQQHFLPPAELAELLKAGIGVEVMDTAAAARTYNILMSEGRKVVAILLL
ncbi:MAG TPA: Mth938-like domain-containing protein [Candidatus Paenalcaligenes intestinipullorum]|uniref:Mth938-like domain-containing protein n=1 Tax=Candidatus Paenalcaligenes intestinipullorum TaxID=2838718 RepID=A0A9D2U8E7_9BURK|nr:Mth938-like domain-containing protein [Candidatus Paenalcaligenes intestinipullorum]